MLRFEVLDVEGSFTTSDASRLDVGRQVRRRANMSCACGTTPLLAPPPPCLCHAHLRFLAPSHPSQTDANDEIINRKCFGRYVTPGCIFESELRPNKTTSHRASSVYAAFTHTHTHTNASFRNRLCRGRRGVRWLLSWGPTGRRRRSPCTARTSRTRRLRLPSGRSRPRTRATSSCLSWGGPTAQEDTGSECVFSCLVSSPA